MAKKVVEEILKTMQGLFGKCMPLRNTWAGTQKVSHGHLFGDRQVTLSIYYGW